MIGVRWQWWVISGAALLLVAAPPTRDMLRMQVAGINPRADYYLWYPLWSSDKQLLQLASLHRLVLRGDAASPSAAAARRLKRIAERRPDDFAAAWGTVRFMPTTTSDPAAGWQAYADAVRRLATRFPGRQEALVLWMRTEIDPPLPQRPEWYRRDLDQLLGVSMAYGGRPVRQSTAASALRAVEAGMQRFPDNGFWLTELAGVYFRMGRDAEGLSALRAAARKPYLDFASAETRRVSVEAAREAGLPFPEALDARAGHPAWQITRTAQILRGVGERAREHGQDKEVVEYCIVGSDLGDLMRRTARSHLQATVGITFTANSSSGIVAELPEKEAAGREPVLGEKWMSGKHEHGWYKGPLYDLVAKQVGQTASQRVVNQLYAAYAMAEAFRADRESPRSKTELDRYQRDDKLSWYFMVAGAGLLALTASLILLFLAARVLWTALRRPQGGLGGGCQAVILALTLAAAVGIAVLLAARAGVLSPVPVLARTVCLLPLSLMAMLAVTAAVRTRALTAPERGMGRCLVGLLHQVAPNAVLVVVVAYLALAAPTVVMRHRITSQGLPYVTGDKEARFRDEIGWDEAKVRYPFPIGESSRSSALRKPTGRDFGEDPAR